MEISDVVTNFHLDSTELEENKLSVLENWRSKVFTTDEFELILKMCSGFHYYSQRKVAFSFQELIDRDNNKELISNKSLFMPYLRDDDHSESSIGVFTQFLNQLKIETYDTYPGITAKKLKIISSVYQEYAYLSTKSEEFESEIAVLKKTISSENDSEKKSVLGRELKEKSLLLSQNKQCTQKLLSFQGKKTFYLENIILVDDFIGSGSSVINLLTELGEELHLLQNFINFYFICLEASEKGIQSINEKLSELKISNFHIINYTEATDILNNSSIFTDEEQVEINNIVKKIEEDYGLQKNPKYSMNTAIASFMNAPNNNVTILSLKNALWYPLFERKQRSQKKVMANRNFDENQFKDKFRSYKKTKG